MLGMRRILIIVTMAALATTACGSGGGGDETVASSVTTTVVASPTTMVRLSPTTTTTAELRPAEAVVASGTSPSGAWQLLARREATGALCALVRVQRQDAGPMVCNEASEMDSSGNATLRYAVVGDGRFLVAVGIPGVARVRVDLRNATSVEEATATPPFTSAARFAALPLPAGSVIRAIVALDDSGRELTRIPVNP
jgi:hypothetical protein